MNYFENPRLGGAKTEKDYIQFWKTKGNKMFFIIHMMKLFYYINYDESKGLHRNKKTLPHWAEEILDVFEIRHLDIKDGLSPYAIKEIKNHLRLRDDRLSFEVWSDHLMTKMGDDDDYYNLPVMSKAHMWKLWEAFVLFYNQFLDDILDRLGTYKSRISRRVFEDYVLTGAKLQTKDPDRLKKKIKQYRGFSTVEDDLRQFIMDHKGDLNLNLQEVKKWLIEN